MYQSNIPIENKLRDYLIVLIENAYLDAINESNYIFEVSDTASVLRHCIEVQYCYDKDYNRMFIEFELSESIKTLLPWERIIAKIHNYINTNFFKDTHVYPEIIAYDDGVNERYDSVQKLSPYTIGYWKCLHGHYEYIYSHQVFMDNMAGLNIPTWNKNFLKEMDNNFNKNYISNYSEFLNEMVRIRTKYKISSDQAPDKKIEDFASKVKNIYDKYLIELTKDQKDSYIQEIINIHGDSNEVKKINKKYGIGEPMWSKIPTIMEEYKKVYKDFFGIDLHDFIGNTKRMYIIQA